MAQSEEYLQVINRALRKIHEREQTTTYLVSAFSRDRFEIVANAIQRDDPNTRIVYVPQDRRRQHIIQNYQNLSKEQLIGPFLPQEIAHLTGNRQTTKHNSRITMP